MFVFKSYARNVKTNVDRRRRRKLNEKNERGSPGRRREKPRRKKLGWPKRKDSPKRRKLGRRKRKRTPNGKRKKLPSEKSGRNEKDKRKFDRRRKRRNDKKLLDSLLSSSKRRRRRRRLRKLPPQKRSRLNLRNLRPETTLVLPLLLRLNSSLSLVYPNPLLRRTLPLPRRRRQLLRTLLPTVLQLDNNLNRSLLV